MADNIVLFETKVYPWEGVPYLATKRKVKLIITRDEIRLVDPKWTYGISLNQIYACIVKPLFQKRTIYTSFPYSYPATIEVMNNFLIIDYRNENGKRSMLYVIFAKHLMIKANVSEAIRFSEIMEKHQINNKFIKNNNDFQ